MSSLAALLWSLSLATPAASGCTPLAGLPITPIVQWPQVQQSLEQSFGCGSNCHQGGAPAGGLDLSGGLIAIYFLVSQPSNQNPAVRLVEPGDPRRSLLWQKLSCSQPDVGAPMPPGGNVPVSLKGLVWDWIAQGAYGEPPEDPIQRDFIRREGFEGLRF